MSPAQGSLFDAPADAMWRSGEITSRAAARSVDTNARERECIEALRRLIVASDCHDIARVLGEYGLVRPTNTIARRLTSLERKGFVRRSGVKQRAAGKPCATWTLTEEGQRHD